MGELFGDERIQFFLRNRADIKAWAAIESDVAAATRELLARAQTQLEESILATDPGALVTRHDGGPFERIMVRHQLWHVNVGLALEWHRSVDPLGNARPKIGVFWWADPQTLVVPRAAFVTSVDRVSLQRLGFKVPLEGVWPVGQWVAAGADWWRDPNGWVAGIVERLTATWPLVASHIDVALSDNSQVSGG